MEREQKMLTAIAEAILPKETKVACNDSSNIFRSRNQG